MLIETDKLQENDVVSMKLVSGEEVVARFVSITADTIKVKKPHVLVQTPQGVALIPYMLSLPEDAAALIDRRVVVIHTKARQEIANGFVQQTSNIMTASTSDVSSLIQNG